MVNWYILKTNNDLSWARSNVRTLWTLAGGWLRAATCLLLPSFSFEFTEHPPVLHRGGGQPPDLHPAQLSFFLKFNGGWLTSGFRNFCRTGCSRKLYLLPQEATEYPASAFNLMKYQHVYLHEVAMSKQRFQSPEGTAPSASWCCRCWNNNLRRKVVISGREQLSSYYSLVTAFTE